MGSATRRDANRQNTLRSTGPRTPAGKSRSSLNAFSTGLYARLAVIPALGETPDQWASFVADVARDLGADGPVEVALAEQVASVLWRLRRVRAAESGAFRPDPATLPPDPDSITGNEVDPYADLPPSASPARRLAGVRGRLRIRRAMLGCVEAAAAIVRGEGDPGGPCHPFVKDPVVEAVAEELAGRWDPRLIDDAIRGLGANPAKVAWTAEFLRRVVAAAGVAAGRDPTAFAAGVAGRVAGRARDLAGGVSELEAEEQALADAVRADRARAAAAATLADEGLLARVAKIESHLGRELERVLGILDRVRAARVGGPAVAAVGFVPPKPVSAGGPRVLPLRERED